MSTTAELAFAAMPDWWLTATVGGGAIAPTASKDCSVVYTGAGVYTYTLGGGGIDSAHCGVEIDLDGAAGLFARVTHTNNTTKVITITDSGDVAADVTRISARFRRLA
jgi:hypothetical protein